MYKSILVSLVLFLLCGNLKAQPGTLDFSFDSEIGANDFVHTISIQSDEKFIVGGRFTTYDNNSSNYIVRLNNNGSIDPSFNVGTGADNFVLTSTIQDDEKILIGGSFTSYNSDNRNRIARINGDNIVSIETLLQNETIIFPNPFYDNITLELNQNIQTLEINIYSIDGKLVYRNTSINSDKITINTEMLNEGIYVLNVICPEENLTFKVIKQ
jgi:hypothetical protein